MEPDPTLEKRWAITRRATPLTHEAEAIVRRFASPGGPAVDVQRLCAFGVLKFHPEDGVIRQAI